MSTMFNHFMNKNDAWGTEGFIYTLMKVVKLEKLKKYLNKLKKSTNTNLDEFISTNCRLLIPTAAIIPNITKNKPPITGSGIVTNILPNLLSIPRMRYITPATCKTWKIRRYGLK